jgi:hypothetical protein
MPACPTFGTGAFLELVRLESKNPFKLRDCFSRTCKLHVFCIKIGNNEHDTSHEWRWLHAGPLKLHTMHNSLQHTSKHHKTKACLGQPPGAMVRRRGTKKQSHVTPRNWLPHYHNPNPRRRRSTYSEFFFFCLPVIISDTNTTFSWEFLTFFISTRVYQHTYLVFLETSMKKANRPLWQSEINLSPAVAK